MEGLLLILFTAAFLWLVYQTIGPPSNKKGAGVTSVYAVDAPFVEGPGDFAIRVAGTSSYQDVLNDICGGKDKDGHELDVEATLVREPNNTHDRNAVAVYIMEDKVGYLPRDAAAEFDGRTVNVDALIIGGWKRGKSNEGHYGVRLDL